MTDKPHGPTFTALHSAERLEREARRQSHGAGLDDGYEQARAEVRRVLDQDDGLLTLEGYRRAFADLHAHFPPKKMRWTCKCVNGKEVPGRNCGEVLCHAEPEHRCRSTCPHGDRCSLEAGHEGGHNHRECDCNEKNVDISELRQSHGAGLPEDPPPCPPDYAERGTQNAKAFEAEEFEPDFPPEERQHYADLFSGKLAAAKALADEALKVGPLRQQGSLGGINDHKRSGWIRRKDADAFNTALEAYRKATGEP